jgi:hypothetical protein
MNDRRRKDRIPIEEASATSASGGVDIFGVINLETDYPIGHGHMMDISSDGFQLIAWNPIQKGAILSLRLRLPQPIGGGLFVVFDAECRWCSRGTDENSYLAGFKIWNITPNNRKRLDKLLYSLGKSQKIVQA